MNNRNHPFPIRAAKGLRRAGWLAAAIGALAASAAIAGPRLGTIEECIESGTSEVTLPGVAGGTLSASPCAGCPSMRLRFDGRTRYFIGKEAVPYARFREAASKGSTRLDVFYRPNDRTLTRLRLAATAAKTQ